MSSASAWGLATAVETPAAAGQSAASAEAVSGAPAVGAALRYDADYPLIGYSDRATHNAIARLQERMERGDTHLKFVPGRGYLDSLLQALGIDPSSQTLVYSKTSLQFELISAATPRAIYFDDDTYVAWPPETKFLEISTMDSVLGPVFYTLPNTDPAATRFDRETLRCLTCHDTYSLMGGGVPRFLFMSSPVTVSGEPLTTDISIETTDATPLQERWGGWYVTGKPDGLVHLGNIQASDPVKSPVAFASLTVNRPGTLEKLDRVFDTRPYLTDHSDVVALLVFEHQVYIENLITRANFKARTLVARANDGQVGDSLSWAQLPPKAQPIVKAMLEPLVKALLLVDAAPLPGRITGNSGFDSWFQAQGPRDRQGRSLRELDLKTRLFRYPLSYMVYSAGFDGLPAYAREYVYGRITDILSGRDHSASYAGLSAADRAILLEILRATKPAFAAITR
ncbi:MAG TPA: hypothetical protein VH209_10670 [Steroidobacteraceae bacterium]|nr:hypothetical protein [Steroidobacteraceae bacterium]